MAFQRSIGGTSMMSMRNGETHKVGAVDKKGPAIKTAAGQTRQTRAALGNLSNRPSVNISKPNASKVLKDRNEISKPVNQKMAVKSKQPVKEAQPETKPVAMAIVEPFKPNVQVEPVAVENVEVKQQEVAVVEKVETGAVPTEAVPMDMSIVSQEGEALEEAFSKQMWKLQVLDIDQDDSDNPQLVSEYVNDIYDYMRELETRFPVRTRCLSNQTEVNERMRSILIDWLIQVHQRFQLLQETLFLTVNIIDRYLQIENVTRNKLQLLGVSAMWIASKYEELYAPEVQDFVYITDNAYTAEQLRQMECHILMTLDFNLGSPLPIHFLRRNSKAGEVDASMHTMAKYLMELTVLDYDMVHLKPSEIAAAALCLALKVMIGGAWTPTLIYYSKYSESELQPIMKKIAQLILNAGVGKLTSIKAKYQSSRFMRISKSPVLEQPILRNIAGLANS